MSNNGVSLAGYEKTMRKCHGILHDTKPKLSSLDWQKMGLEDLGPEDTVVLDPPYPNGNVRSYSDATVDYESLVDLLLRARFKWVLCGYPHPVLCRLGKSFWARDVNLCVLGASRNLERSACGETPTINGTLLVVTYCQKPRRAH